MIVEVPRKIKEAESRILVTPAGAEEYVTRAHSLLVERLAGVGSGFGDDRHATAGAELVASLQDVFRRAEMIVRAKQPIEPEYAHLRPGRILFTSLHLGAERALTDALLARGVIAVADETVRSDSGELPLLTPIGDVAGRMALQVAADWLWSRPWGAGASCLRACQEGRRRAPWSSAAAWPARIRRSWPWEWVGM